ncbi:MAG: hypothetical protein IKP00_13115 [Victivallales bacterium]|nr:hypothetical protein [Victivallales bacterium]
MKKHLFCLFAAMLSLMLSAAPVPWMELRDAVTRERLAAVPGRMVAGITWNVAKTSRNDADLYDITLKVDVKESRGMVFTAGLPFAKADAVFLRTPYVSEKVSDNRTYAEVFDNMTGGPEGGYSRYPVNAVAHGKKGLALAVDTAFPVKERIEYDAENERFNIHFDFAATSMQKELRFRFAVYEFTNNWGFRSALACYYEVFPDYAEQRVRKHGMSLAFANATGIEGIEDFRIAFRSTFYEPVWDAEKGVTEWPRQAIIAQEIAKNHEAGILTFRYHEPGSWWMAMKPGTPRTYEAAFAQLKEAAERGNSKAQAILQAPMMTADGRFMVSFSKQTWNDGCVWSCSTLPKQDAPARFDSYYLISDAKIATYQNQIGENLAGEEYDSMGGYMRDVLDFNPVSMAAATYPLVYDFVTRRPALSVLLMQSEYARWSADKVHAAGRLTYANNVRSAFLARNFDVLVSETDWKRGGKWKPQTKEELIFYRVLAKGKPHSSHLNTDLRNFSVAEVERFCRRMIAFGYLPTIFNNRGQNYFRTPDAYNRDREVFRRYMPLAVKISEAGWEPETLARSNFNDILVERFGNYLTVFNDGGGTRDVELTIENMDAPLHFPMQPYDLRVYDLTGKPVEF